MSTLALRIVRSTVERRWFKVIRLSSRGFSASSVLNTMEKTFGLQDKLPSLPVPPLPQTCERYLDSVKPHLTKEEFLQTQFVVNEFASGVGKELQKKLEMRGKNFKNWLETWWEDVAYLTSRSPSAPMVNIGGPMNIEDMWPVQDGTQIKRAALMVHGLAVIWQTLYRQVKPIDRMGAVPLCMFQFTRLFSCCKIPGREKDSLKASFVTAPHRSPRHIIVQTRGRIFSCTVLDENLEPLSPPEIERQLQEIQSIAEASLPGLAIGSLTGEERTVWYELRERLINLDRNNQKNLDVIETSLFALVLDETTPVTDTEVCRESVIGDCKNRWFDKSLSILVFKSGRLAPHCDLVGKIRSTRVTKVVSPRSLHHSSVMHAPFDGVVEIGSIVLALKYLEENGGGKWKGSMEIKNYFKPQELVFTTDDVICDGIRQAVQKYEKAAALINLMVYHPDEYGKGSIKPLRVHPDTFVQMAIQLAYYKLHGKPAPTYETAQTRQFYHGRTDTVRSCTVESTAWCKAMADNNIDNSTRVRLFREACKKHDKLMKEAVDGQGIDRHLLGLQLIAASEGIPTPAIYLDKAWTASGGGANFVLSTSCVGFTPHLGGCAAMVTDGYGAFYSIEENMINFVIATFKNSDVTDGTKFQNALGESLSDMKRLLLTPKL